MGREFELKYMATPEILSQIRTQFENFETISMETTYFDTADGALSAGKCTLRRRLENGQCVCTLKTPGDGHSRGEWELVGEWSSDAVTSLFAGAGIPAVPFGLLEPVCGARFTRLAAHIRIPNACMELALDEGVLLGGGSQMPLCELEVELKEGSEDAVSAWAEALAAQYSLSPQPKSKFRRAKELAQGDHHG